jgi:hypothetical protein
MCVCVWSLSTILKFVLTLADGLCCAWFIYTLSYVDSSIDWAQFSRFHLKTEIESSLRNVVLNKNMTMNNAQKHNNWINVP